MRTLVAMLKTLRQVPDVLLRRVNAAVEAAVERERCDALWRAMGAPEERPRYSTWWYSPRARHWFPPEVGWADVEAVYGPSRVVVKGDCPNWD